jgi:molecular chaperone GrpE
MENAFAKIGIVKIESIGEILNPQFHNAIQMVDKPDEKTPTNTIIDELQPGYMFGDTVLRTAMVIVSK